MVQLHRYLIDTGIWSLPSDYAVLGPSYSNDTYVEGMRWSTGSGDIIDFTIMERNQTIDPLQVIYVYLSHACKDNDTFNKTAVRPVNKPYPGWVSSFEVNGTDKHVVVYAGSVNNNTALLYTSSDEPSTVAYRLKDLRIIPRAWAANAITAKVVEGLG